MKARALGREKYRWERTRASRPVHPTLSIYGHITALLGAGLPSDDCVALPVVAQLVVDRRQHAPSFVYGDVYQFVNQNTSEQDFSAWNVLDHQTSLVGTCVSYVRE